MQAIPLKNRNANCERLLKQKPPPRGRKGRGLELTQVMDDAVYLWVWRHFSAEKFRDV